MERGKIRRERLQFEDNYTQIPNAWLRDEALSIRARGLLGILLSHKAGWQLALTDLVTRHPNGRTREGDEAVRTAVRELEAGGYLVRERVRDDGGRLRATDWVLQEPPTAANRPLVWSGDNPGDK